MAHQEEGPQMGQSSCCHPEHMEEVEGKIFCVVVPSLIKSLRTYAPYATYATTPDAISINNKSWQMVTTQC